MSALASRTLYSMCGLRIASAIPLPELRPDPGARDDSPSDVQFEMGGRLSPADPGPAVMTRTAEDGSPWLTCFATRDDYRLHFPGLADFVVARSGASVCCSAHRGTPRETIRHLFLDQVVPLLLNLMGREALHASAARLPHGVCAFLGASGSGKSTLAGAFQVAGYPVFSDDCLPVRVERGKVLAEPSYPGLRLWSDSVEFLFKDPQLSRPVSHYSSKVRVLASGPKPAAPQPLRAIYLLGRSQRRSGKALPRIESQTLRDAVMGLIRYTFRLDLSDRAMLLRQARTLEGVARRVPVRRLLLGGDLDTLASVPEMILHDLDRE